MKKKRFYSELCYIFGMIALALGAALMARADFGLSMVVAPAYILHLKVSETLPFFTFGMAEYALQSVILLLMLVLRRGRLAYLLSFATAVLYGFTLDGLVFLVSFIDCSTVFMRVVFYVLGLACCAVGVSFFFHTYFSPEAYELCVKEISSKYGFNINKVKTAYDCVSCLIGIILSFAFFGLGHFEGVKWGTVLCALINGASIGLFSKFIDKRFEFVDLLPWRGFFLGEKRAESRKS